MTREECVERWCVIIPTVFRAEHDLDGQWLEKLKNREITPDEYIKKIAELIVSETTDEELEEIS